LPPAAGTPDCDERWQRKKRKTYAQKRCEQVVGNFALKWFFGSQLLRLRPLLSRLRIVLSHVSLPFPPRLPQCQLLDARHQSLAIHQFPLPSAGGPAFKFLPHDDAGTQILT
jgi:hypothetical protein